jgi:hypothetical protein
MSQWTCKNCGAFRQRPTTARVRESATLYSVRFLGSGPCKRCGSEDEPEAIFDPWLDFADEPTETVPSKSGGEG